MDNNRTEKGTFLPGNTGKPKGALNKLSQQRKDQIELVLGVADDLVEEALRQFKPNELLDIWLGLRSMFARSCSVIPWIRNRLITK